jgi:two-component system response regulator CpxR
MSALKKPSSSINPLTRRLLIIDDDVELCELLAEYLQPEGFQVEAVHTGTEAVEKALTGNYALLVLDVMLPGLRGFDVLQKIRATSRIPVIMLTARGEDVDRILGLEIGADDYLPKPFNPRELAARIQAVLRRTDETKARGASGGEELVRVGDLELSPASRVVRRNNHEVDLTAVEFDLLKLFLSSPGVVLEREYLAHSVLGRNLTSFDRSIDVHVSNLRRKLGWAPDGGERIKAVRGAGYLYSPPLKSKAK